MRVDGAGSRLRVWLDAPNIFVSYERDGIVIAMLQLRREAMDALVKRAIETWDDLIATGEPERVAVISEFLDMVKVVLAGGDGQIMPLTKDDASIFADIFGAPS
jgi:hypothetical protein